jgi:hypothetical protein
MKRKITTCVALALLLTTAGCGYFKSGTWEDDPKNWKRAFRSVKPPDVVVTHSLYWRSPHWTYEFQYFFEIEPNTELREQLFRENQLRRLEGAQAQQAKENSFGEIPAWFAPKPSSAYDIWVFGDEPGRNFKVLIDKETGTLFLSDHQV